MKERSTTTNMAGFTQYIASIYHINCEWCISYRLGPSTISSVKFLYDFIGITDYSKHVIYFIVLSTLSAFNSSQNSIYAFLENKLLKASNLDSRHPQYSMNQHQCFDRNIIYLRDYIFNKKITIPNTKAHITSLKFVFKKGKVLVNICFINNYVIKM